MVWSKRFTKFWDAHRTIGPNGYDMPKWALVAFRSNHSNKAYKKYKHS